MSHSIRLLAIDLDGTLLRSDDTVSEANCLAVRRAAEAGVVTVIATGRPRGEAQFVLDAIPEVGFLIGMNGGLVEDLRAGTILQDNPFATETALDIIERLDAAGFFYQIYSRDDVYCKSALMGRLWESGMPHHYLAMFAERIREWPEAGGLPIYKVLAMARSPERSEALRELVGERPGIKVLCSLAEFGYHEILPTERDKEPALASLCARLGIESRETMAIGDSENDEKMLNFAGVSVAVGNAPSRLREQADFVSATNDQDGVAAAIQHFLFPANQ